MNSLCKPLLTEKFKTVSLQCMLYNKLAESLWVQSLQVKIKFILGGGSRGIGAAYRTSFHVTDGAINVTITCVMKDAAKPPLHKRLERQVFIL